MPAADSSSSRTTCSTARHPGPSGRASAARPARRRPVGVGGRSPSAAAELGHHRGQFVRHRAATSGRSAANDRRTPRPASRGHLRAGTAGPTHQLAVGQRPLEVEVEVVLPGEADAPRAAGGSPWQRGVAVDAQGAGGRGRQGRLVGRPAPRPRRRPRPRRPAAPPGPPCRPTGASPPGTVRWAGRTGPAPWRTRWPSRGTTGRPAACSAAISVTTSWRTRSVRNPPSWRSATDRVRVDSTSPTRRVGSRLASGATGGRRPSPDASSTHHHPTVGVTGGRHHHRAVPAPSTGRRVPLRVQAPSRSPVRSQGVVPKATAAGLLPSTSPGDHPGLAGASRLRHQGGATTVGRRVRGSAPSRSPRGARPAREPVALTAQLLGEVDPQPP